MNRIYRNVWNEVTRTYVAAAEIVRGRGKRSKSSATAQASEAAMSAVSPEGLMAAIARAQAQAQSAATKVQRRLRGAMPRPMLLEQRFMFDGAALVDGVDTVSKAIEATATGTKTVDKTIHLDIVAPAGVTVSDTVRTAKAEAEKLVADFLARPDAKEQLFALFNGGKTAPDAAWNAAFDQLMAEIQSGVDSIRVELRSGTELQGAFGAFAQSGSDGSRVIYLNSDWVTSSATSSEIAAVLIEEAGHSIDAVLNGGDDTAGDEGAVFALIAENQATTISVIDQVTDSDNGTLTIDGVTTSVEFSWSLPTPFDSGWTTLGRPGDINKATDGWNTSANAPDLVGDANSPYLQYKYGQVNGDDVVYFKVRAEEIGTASTYTTPGIQTFIDLNLDGKPEFTMGFTISSQSNTFDSTTGAMSAITTGREVWFQALNDDYTAINPSATVVAGLNSDGAYKVMSDASGGSYKAAPSGFSLQVYRDLSSSTSGTDLDGDTNVRENFYIISIPLSEYSAFTTQISTANTTSPGTWITPVSSWTTSTQFVGGSLSTTSGLASYTGDLGSGNYNMGTTTTWKVIWGLNDAPVAVDNTYTATEDTLLTSKNIISDDVNGSAAGGVDSDAETTLSALTISKINGVSLDTYTTDGNGWKQITLTDSSSNAIGTLYVKQDGSIQYQPASNNTTAASFTYTIKDTGVDGSNIKESATATVTINVTPVNDAPVVVDDTGNAIEIGTFLDVQSGINPIGRLQAQSSTVALEQISTGTVLSGSPTYLTASSTSTTNPSSVTGSYGTLRVGADGSYVYLLDEANASVVSLRADTTSTYAGAGLTENYTYTYRVASGALQTATMTVVIKPGATTVLDNRLDIQVIGSEASGNIKSNDSDVDSVNPTVTSAISSNGNSLSSGTVTGRYGTLTLNTSTGAYSYAVDNSSAAVQALRLVTDTLTETFTYTLSDGSLSSTANLTITIAGANDAPVAKNDYGTAKESLAGTAGYLGVTAYSTTAGSTYDSLGYKATGQVKNNDTDVDGGDAKYIEGLSATAVLSTQSVNYTSSDLTFNSNSLNSVATNSEAWLLVNVSSTPTWCILLGSDGTTRAYATGNLSGNAMPMNTYPAKYLDANDGLVKSVNWTVAQTVGFYEDNIATSLTQSTIASNKQDTTSTTQTATGTTTITLSNINGTVLQGMSVTGTGIPFGTTVSSVDYSTNAITLSSLLTASAITNTPLIFTAATGVTVTGRYGVFVLASDGTYTYTPTVNQTLSQTDAPVTETFRYITYDSLGARSAANVVITVYGSGSNDPNALDDGPTAGTEVGTLVAGTNPSGNVLTNDKNVNTDPDTPATGSSLSITGAARIGDASFTGPSSNLITLVGEYGTLYIAAANGATYPTTYTTTGGTLTNKGDFLYVIDNSNTTVNALQAGQTALTEVFRYQVTNTTANTAPDTARLTITINGSNDAPTLDLDTSSGATTHYSATFTEGGSAVPLATTAGINIADVDSSTFNKLTLSYTAANFADGANERLLINGATVNGTLAGLGTLSTAGAFTLGGVVYDYSVASSSGTTTLTFTGDNTGTLTLAQIEALVDAFRYENTSQNPTAGSNRVFTITAFDNDTGALASNAATATITVAAVNDLPSISLSTTIGAVYEAGLSTGSNAAAATESYSGTFTISDLDGLSDISTLTFLGSDGSTVKGTLNFATVLNDLANQTPVAVNLEKGTFRLTAYSNGTFTYRYDLSAAVTDADGVAETETFSIRVTDSGPATATATLTVEIVDDVPSVTASSTAPTTTQVLTTSDTGTSASPSTDSKDFAGAFTSTFTVVNGADVPVTSSTTTYQLSLLVSPGSDSGLQTSTGSTIYLYKIGSAIVGSTSTTEPSSATDSSVVFSLSNSGSTVTLSQVQAIRQTNDVEGTSSNPYDGDYTDDLATLGTGLIGLAATRTVVDKDGDSSSAIAELDLGGGAVRFADDGPNASTISGSVTTAQASPTALVVDETDGTQAGADTSTAGTTSASFASLFETVTSTVDGAGDYGTDGAGSLAYSLSLVKTSDASAVTSPLGSGLFALDASDTETVTDPLGKGSEVLLKMGTGGDAGVLIGYVNDGSSDVEYFRITVNASGTVTFTQATGKNLWHSTTSDANDAATLALSQLSGSVDVALRLTQTVTDADGDQASAFVDLVSSATATDVASFSIRDDGPNASTISGSVTTAQASPTALVVDETDGTQAGADTSTAGTTSASFASLFETVTSTVDGAGDYGTDGAGSLAYSLSLVKTSDASAVTSPLGSGLFALDASDTETVTDPLGKGSEVLLKMGTGGDAGVLIGYVNDGSSDVEYFRITVNASGTVTFTQATGKNLWHSTTSDANDAATLALSQLSGSVDVALRLTQTVTDADGDQASAFVDLVSSATATDVASFSIRDDGPNASTISGSVTTAQASPTALVVDETDGTQAGADTSTAGTTSASFASLFETVTSTVDGAGDYGTDGAGSLAYSLSLVKTSDASAVTSPLGSGLFALDASDTETVTDPLGKGSEVLLKMGTGGDAGVLIGYVNDGSSDVEYFRITVNASGTVTFTQATGKNLWHSTTSDANDAATLALSQLSGSVDVALRLTQTVTDADGDQASAFVDLVSSATATDVASFSIRDDGPNASTISGSVTTAQASPTALVVDETDGTQAGADTSTAGTTSASFASLFETVTSTVDGAGDYGTDGAGSLAYSLSLVKTSDASAVTSPLGSGLFALDASDTETVTDPLGKGSEVLLKMGTGGDAGVLIGYVNDGSSDVEYFRITVNASGTVTFTQATGKNLWHSTTSDANDAATLALSQLSGSVDVALRLTQTVTDADGDQASAFVDLVSSATATDVASFSIRDDGPNASTISGSVTTAQASPTALVVDETDGTQAGADTSTAGTTSASFASLFETVTSTVDGAGDYGTDGAGSLAYSLSLVKTSDASAVTSPLGSGLFALDASDTETVTDPLGKGSEVLLKMGTGGDAGVLIGYVNDGSSDVEYFRITVNASGTVTFTQATGKNLWHSTTSDANDAATLALSQLSGSVDVALRLTQTVTDADGDQASAFVDLVSSATATDVASFSIRDDGPNASTISGSVTTAQASPTALVVDETDGTQAGADTSTAGTTSASFASLFETVTSTVDGAGDYGTDGAGSLAYSLSLVKTSDASAVTSPLGSGLFALDASDTETVTDPLGKGSEVLLKMGTGGDAGVLIGYVNDGSSDVEYFRITVNASGTVTFTQATGKNLWHSTTSDANDAATLALSQLSGSVDVALRLTQTVTDADGDQASAFVDLVSSATATDVASFSIRDDGPNASTISGSVTTAQASPTALVVDETDGTQAGADTSTAGTTSASFASLFETVTSTVDGAGDYGTDGAGSLAYSLSLVKTSDASAVTSPLGSGLFALDASDTETVTDPLGKGSEVLLKMGTGGDAGVLIGYVNDGSSDVEYFRITVNASGTVTFTQATGKNLWHSTTSDANDAATLALSQLSGSVDVALRLTQTVTDADGDQASAFVDLVSSATATDVASFSIRDDGPNAVRTTPISQVTITLDEFTLTGAFITNTGDFSGYFASSTNYGTDGAGSVGYALDLNASTVDSGLFALGTGGTQGSQIVLSMDVNDVVGKVGTTEYLRISVNSSGVVTFTQSENIWNATLGATSTLSLGSGAFQLKQTVTDADGDQDSEPLDLGAAGAFKVITVPPLTVNDVLVNEGSKYAVFEVSGAAGQLAMLSLSSASGDGGTDAAGNLADLRTSGNLPTIQYYDATLVSGQPRGWVNYDATNPPAIPSGSAPLYVRTVISAEQEDALDGPETFRLVATTTSGLDSEGIATIFDDGTGKKWDDDPENNDSPTLSPPEGPGAGFDDDRVPSVMGTTVNEASPFVMWTVSNVFEGQKLKLSLGNTSSGGDNDAELTAGSDPADVGPQLQYWNGVVWTNYNPGELITVPSDGDGTAAEQTTLKVRLAVTNDTATPVYEGPETLELKAETTSGTSGTGVSTIVDDGTGKKFVFDGDNDPTNDPQNPTETTGPGAGFDDDRVPSVTGTTVNEASPFVMWTVSNVFEGQKLKLSLGNTSSGGDNDAELTAGSDPADVGPQLQYWNGNAWTDYVNGSLIDVPSDNDLTLAEQTTLKVRLAVINDTATPVYEGPETLELKAETTSGTSGTGVSTIVDDGTGKKFVFDGDNDPTNDPQNPTETTGPGAGFDDDRRLSVTSPTVNEASPHCYFEVTGGSNQVVTLNLQPGTAGGDGLDYGSTTTKNITISTDGGATWSDYTGGPVTLSADGKMLVRTPMVEDNISDNNETFTLTATNTGGTPTTGTATIKDDGTGTVFLPNGGPDPDKLPTDDRPLSVNDIEISESSPYGVFKVSGASGQLVKLELVSGTATVGSDTGSSLEYFDGTNWQPYTPGSFVRIPEGSTALLVRVPIVNDAVLEGKETFQLIATNTGGTASAPGTASVYDDGTNGKRFEATNNSGDPTDGEPNDDTPIPPKPVIVPPAPPETPVETPPAPEPKLVIEFKLPPIEPVPVGDIVTSSSGFPITVVEGSQPNLVVFNGITDQFVEARGVQTVQLPADAFAHTRSDAVVTLIAQLSDGSPLPPNILFNSQAGTFQVTPRPGVSEELEITVIARDGEGREAATKFKLNIGEAAKPTSSLSRPALTELLRNASVKQRDGAFSKFLMDLQVGQGKAGAFERSLGSDKPGAPLREASLNANGDAPAGKTVRGATAKPLVVKG